jgi:hypothetical protein
MTSPHTHTNKDKQALSVAKGIFYDISHTLESHTTLIITRL